MICVAQTISKKLRYEIAKALEITEIEATNLEKFTKSKRNQDIECMKNDLSYFSL